jgi:hypothetical protein
MISSSSESSARDLSLIALLTATLVVAVILIAAWFGLCPAGDLCGPVVATDQAQTRIDTALPAPRGDLIIEQTFSARHAGLSAVELVIVHYGGEAPGGNLTLALRGEDDALVAEQTLASGNLTHNETVLFEFLPQPDSQGRIYTLRLSGDEANHAGVWGYSLDVVQPGRLTVLPVSGVPVPETAAQALRFVTQYHLAAGGSLAFLARTVVHYSGLFLALFALLLMPGCLLLLLSPRRSWDSAAWLGAALALGLSVWPLLWLWFSLVGGRWSGPLLWVVLAAGWTAVGVIAWRRRQGERGRSRRRQSQADAWTLAALALLLGVSLAVRLLAVRDLAFPAWVDSSRHGLITAVMVEQGRAPGDYSPYLPVDRFPYHYGFHAIAASLALMTGIPLAGLLLVLGQVLIALAPLTVYAAGWMVSRQRVVGLLAAFLVALPFFFPGYYATWGRMTQISAMLVLPVLLGLAWRLGRGWPSAWPLAAVLGAGVFMLHFRVFLFFMPFALLVLLLQLISYRRWRPYLAAGGLGLALITPRAFQLWRDANPAQAIQNSVAGFNDFPTGYVTAGWETLFYGLAAAGLVVVLIGVVRGERWALFPLVLVAWVASLFFLLAGERLGLPETLVVNLNSMIISLFVPLSLFLALAAVRLWTWGGRLLRGRPGAPAFRVATAVGLGAALGVLALFGARLQIGILNPQTILAEPEDVTALAWVDANLPPEATVAVNSWQWLGSTWAAGDGGAWLVPLTGRTATTPPIDHIYNPTLFAGVRTFNEQATAVADWSDPAAADWLREQGVSHVYVGRRGGFFDPATLLRNPRMRAVYQTAGTFVFELTTP